MVRESRKCRTSRPSSRTRNSHEFPPGQDLSPLYRDWGFPVYRTTYNLSSDRQWKTLGDRMQARVANETATAAPRLLSLFRLEPRSSADTLDGADMDRVRRLYREAAGARR